YRRHKTDENGESVPDRGSFYGRHYEIPSDHVIRFLRIAEEQAQQGKCRFMPMWDRNAVLGLTFALDDQGILVDPEVRARVKQHMDPEERKMYDLADEHGIDIVRYQVGRRICSLPPEVRAIF